MTPTGIDFSFLFYPYDERVRAGHFPGSLATPTPCTGLPVDWHLEDMCLLSYALCP